MDSEGTSHVRRHPRSPLASRTLPGRLLADDLRRQVRAEGVDVSQIGLGIVTEEPLLPGDPIWLVTVDRAIKLMVQHCRKGPDGRGYRCGLKAAASWENLESLFST